MVVFKLRYRQMVWLSLLGTPVASQNDSDLATVSGNGAERHSLPKATRRAAPGGSAGGQRRGALATVDDTTDAIRAVACIRFVRLGVVSCLASEVEDHSIRWPHEDQLGG